MTKQETCYNIVRNKKLIKKKGGTKLLDITASNSIVAVRLKNVISEKGLKQASVASKAGFTSQELNDMLNGRRIMRAADIASLISVVKDFGVDANYLFGIEKGE